MLLQALGMRFSRSDHVRKAFILMSADRCTWQDHLVLSLLRNIPWFWPQYRYSVDAPFYLFNLHNLLTRPSLKLRIAACERLAWLVAFKLKLLKVGVPFFGKSDQWSSTLNCAVISAAQAQKSGMYAHSLRFKYF